MGDAATMDGGPGDAVRERSDCGGPALCRDTISGGAGVDRLRLITRGGGARIDLTRHTARYVGFGATVDGVENVRGTAYPDILVGDQRSNLLMGDGGADVIIGRGGADVANGGRGRDLCRAEVRRTCER